MLNPAPTTLVELYQLACQKYSGRRLFGTRSPSGWSWIDYADLPRRVDRCRAGLAERGVRPGDRVALISNNRVEWAVVAYATFGLGAALVPMYEAQTPAEWDFILADSGTQLVVAATGAMVEHLEGLSGRALGLRHVVGLDLPPEDPRSYEALCGAGSESPIREVKPDDVAGLIYTSGTTGRPKGVVLTHRNIVCNVAGVAEFFSLDRDLTLSFLPWTHSFGQTADLHTMIHSGVSIAINDSPSRLVENLKEVRPTLICAVPRVFGRLHESAERIMADKPRMLRVLYRSGLDVALKRNRGEPITALERAVMALADRVLFSRIRKKLGGRIRFVVSGSAALGREVGDFIGAIGIPVYEGYGLTEASPIVTANSERASRPGSVGRPFPGVRVTLDTEQGGQPGQGEIVVYGANVMRGYHNRPEETREVLMPDGGLRTGDLGTLDSDGFLFVTGRIKEQYGKREIRGAFGHRRRAQALAVHPAGARLRPQQTVQCGARGARYDRSTRLGGSGGNRPG